MAQTKAAKPADTQRGMMIWQRLIESAKAIGLDPRVTSQIGMLRLLRKLSDEQAAAADKIGQVYGRFETIHGRGRSARSPSYLLGCGPGPREWDDDVVAAAEADFRRVQDCIPLLPRETREAIELLCVENCALSSWQLRLIYDPLNAVADEFALGTGDEGSPLAPTRKRAPSRAQRLEMGIYAYVPADAVPRHAPDTDDHADTVRRLEENAVRLQRAKALGELAELDAEHF